MTNPCPCGSNQNYAECCALFHNNIKKPNTPEQLMRSRYTAFSKGLTDYILQTERLPHPNTKSDLEEWCSQTHWEKLEIVASHEGENNNTQGTVHYKAWFRENSLPRLLEEKSFFTKIEDQWYYTDGEAHFRNCPIENQTPRRNDPCPCGSGKKYKKCCG